MDGADTYTKAVQFADAIAAACYATKEATVLWFRVLWPIATLLMSAVGTVTLFLLRVTRAGAVMAWPYVVQGAHATQEVVRNTDPLVLAAIALFFVLIVLAWLLKRLIVRRKYVQRTYKWYRGVHARVGRQRDRIMTDIRRKSRIVADLLPHVLLLLVAVAALTLVPDRMASLTKGWELLFAGIFFPTCASVLSLRAYATRHAQLTQLQEIHRRALEDRRVAAAPRASFTSHLTGLFRRGIGAAASRAPEQASEAAEEDKSPELKEAEKSMQRRSENVKSWVTYWIVFAAVMLLTEVPFLGGLVSHLPKRRELMLFFILWLQLPFTDGATIGFHCLVPLISRYVKDVPPVVPHEQQNIILNTLVLLRLISDKTKHTLAELFATGGTPLLLSVVFFFTPGFITHYGCQLVGIGYPIYASVVAVRNNRDPSLLHWLTYWTVFAVLTFLHEWVETFFGFLPFWYHAELIFTLWLQLPLIGGAERVFRTLSARVEKLFAVDDARKRSQSMGASPLPQQPQQPQPQQQPDQRQQQQQHMEDMSIAEDGKAELEEKEVDDSPRAAAEQFDRDRDRDFDQDARVQAPPPEAEAEAGVGERAGAAAGVARSLSPPVVALVDDDPEMDQSHEYEVIEGAPEQPRA